MCDIYCHAARTQSSVAVSVVVNQCWTTVPIVVVKQCLEILHNLPSPLWFVNNLLTADMQTFVFLCSEIHHLIDALKDNLCYVQRIWLLLLLI